MKAAALRGALSDRAREGRVHVVSAFVDGDAPKTKAALATLTAVTQAKRVLVVLDRDDVLNWVSLRNVPQVHLIEAGQLNTYDVLVADEVVFTETALAEYVAGPVQGRGQPSSPDLATHLTPGGVPSIAPAEGEGTVETATAAEAPAKKAAAKKAPAKKAAADDGDEAAAKKAAAKKAAAPRRPPPRRLAADDGGSRRDHRGEGMSVRDPRDVLLAPVISEKSYGLLDANQYTFIVLPEANKTQIKIAVEQIFKVKVLGVNTINRQGKRKRSRGTQMGKRKDTKRAIVSARPRRPHRDLRGPGRLTALGPPTGPERTDRDSRPMAIRKYKPTTPGRRGSSVADFAEVTRDHPEKSLVRPLHGRGGRNVHGKVTARHQGGGHKRAYRLIDFRRADKDGVPAKVAHIEYDPNRTSRIALLHYADGEKRYIIAPAKLKQGDTVECGPVGRHQARQQPAAAEHPGRHGGSRHRAPSRWRREDRPLRGHQRPAGRP